ncbi:hypothetical protein [Streptomyces goshikiensis]|uniref:hypothetical protein n=1 Tax=Streptomyces goshikiensis TaxID=1942 RepID=UPI0036544985
MPDADRLAEIRARVNAATKGPWTVDQWEIHSLTGWVGETCDVADYPRSIANATFVAAARQDVPDLLAEVARLRARVAELEAAKDSFLLPWAHKLDAKSLDNFVIDLARAADAPLLFVVDEIHQTVAQWRELVATKAAETGASDGR